MHFKLIEAKEILVNYATKLSTDTYGYESLDYLIDTIDYLTIGKIPCNEEILNIILEDILVCNCYEKTTELTRVACLITDVIKELSVCMK